jgi:hypothetical protein
MPAGVCCSLLVYSCLYGVDVYLMQRLYLESRQMQGLCALGTPGDLANFSSFVSPITFFFIGVFIGLANYVFLYLLSSISLVRKNLLRIFQRNTSLQITCQAIKRREGDKKSKSSRQSSCWPTYLEGRGGEDAKDTRSGAAQVRPHTHQIQ